MILWQVIFYLLSISKNFRKHINRIEILRIPARLTVVIYETMITMLSLPNSVKLSGESDLRQKHNLRRFRPRRECIRSPLLHHQG
jgi:hypothetical protein